MRKDPPRSLHNSPPFPTKNSGYAPVRTPYIISHFVVAAAEEAVQQIEEIPLPVSVQLPVPVAPLAASRLVLPVIRPTWGKQPASFSFSLLFSSFLS